MRDFLNYFTLESQVIAPWEFIKLLINSGDTSSHKQTGSNNQIHKMVFPSLATIDTPSDSVLNYKHVQLSEIYM